MKTIKLNNNVVVSDPCYTIPTWCHATLDNVLPGNYRVFCKKHDLGDWGVRNSALLVVHEDYLDRVHFEWEQHPATIGVDSGQCGIFSRESYRNDSHPIENGPAEFGFGRDEEGDVFYSKMCQRTLADESFGVYDEGAVCSSGIGDGSYVLLEAREENGYVIALCVDFLIEGDEDEGEEILNPNFFKLELNS